MIIARELLGGIIPDIWLIVRGYTRSAFYVAFIVVHAAVIASGLWAVAIGTPGLRPPVD
ncbi:MAG TPA: hypothetical protein VGS12_01770 [Caulobacteraceae bacterium]|nr:hypothetical protein [Caulobacteraceae bacterium]